MITLAQMIQDARNNKELTQKTVSLDALVLELQKKAPFITRPQVVQACKELDQSGFGKFLVGRSGHPTRFIFEPRDPQEKKPSSKKEKPVTAPKDKNLQSFLDDMSSLIDRYRE